MAHHRSTPNTGIDSTRPSPERNHRCTSGDSGIVEGSVERGSPLRCYLSNKTHDTEIFVSFQYEEI